MPSRNFHFGEVSLGKKQSIQQQVTYKKVISTIEKNQAGKGDGVSVDKYYGEKSGRKARWSVSGLGAGAEVLEGSLKFRISD